MSRRSSRLCDAPLSDADLNLSGRWTDVEKQEVGRLAALHQVLNLDDPFTNRESCKAYLKQIETCADQLNIDALPRTYRNTFTANYRHLLTDDQKRNYHIDLMKASADRCLSVCVNGRMSSFSAWSIKSADELGNQLFKLSGVLGCWNTTCESDAEGQSMTETPSRAEVRAVLADVDHAWLAFERTYIEELMSIESAALKPFVDAVIHEHRLGLLEGKHEGTFSDEDSTQYCMELQKLFACLAELNKTANVNGTGRDDLNAEALYAAWEVVSQQRDTSTDAEPIVFGDENFWDPLGIQRDSDSSRDTGNSDILHALAEDFLDSFQAMRAYLRNTGCWMDRVNPQLNRNSGLASRLEDFEKAWELCHNYIQDKAMRDALVESTEAIAAAQVVVPNLRHMCSERDAEVFFVLPRLIWLGFLREPKHDKLLRRLLPNCFIQEEAPFEALFEKNAELQSLVEQFNSALLVLVEAQGPQTDQATKAAEIVAWEMLTHRAVLGAGLDDSDMYEKFTASLQQKSRSAVEDFMLKLEAWSVELQRHCPRDWNAYCATMVQWISGELKKDRH